LSIPIYEEVEKGIDCWLETKNSFSVDGILLSEKQIDYSFVTGEAVPIVKHSEIKFWGKQIGKMIEMEVLQNRLSKLFDAAVE
jgi:Cu+-exporting ATPase